MDPSQVLPQAPEERVPDLSLGGLRAILDLGQKLGFNPDSLVADALGIGLGLSDEGFKPLLEVGGRTLSKPWSTLPAWNRSSPLRRPT
jgi:hypothetical protein